MAIWLNKLLERGDIYLVGGPVRDELLGFKNTDLDLLACQIPASEIPLLLKPYGTIHLVGKSFGVFKFHPFGQEQVIDIALPRKEKSTGHGHRDFEVQSDENIPVAEDLQRRDFTINAMAKSLKSGEIIDPYGGQQDLEKKILRQVFDKTFEEDPLRLLRGCQFKARFELTVEKETLEGMKQNAALVKAVSAERIFKELEKLLRAPRPSLGFRLMQETGLLQEILPELEATVGIPQPKEFHRWPVFDHILQVIDAAFADNLPVRWAALCHDLGKPSSQGIHPKNGRITFWGHEKISQHLTRNILKRLRAPEKLINKVVALCKEHMFPPESALSDKALRRLIARVGPEHIEDLILLRRADRLGNGLNHDLDEWERLKQRVTKELKGGSFDRKDLAIDGAQLIKELKIPAGPALGQLLDRLLEFVIDDPESNRLEILLQKARQWCQKNKK